MEVGEFFEDEEVSFENVDGFVSFVADVDVFVVRGSFEFVGGLTEVDVDSSVS